MSGQWLYWWAPITKFAFRPEVVTIAADLSLSLSIVAPDTNLPPISSPYNTDGKNMPVLVNARNYLRKFLNFTRAKFQKYKYLHSTRKIKRFIGALNIIYFWTFYQKERLFTLYRSGTVNSNTVNSKFHLIRSYCEYLARILSFHV